jgi:predicted nucleic acid-binding protein
MARTNPSPVVVSDAGPLIHLDEIDCLELLSDFTVWVPNRVREESLLHRPKIFRHSYSFLVQLPGPTGLKPHLKSLAKALSLDPGELEALSLMERNPSAIFLTDDAAARLAAQTLGYRVHGTIGILLRSIRRGRFSRLEVIERLQAIPGKSSLHIRSSLLHEIVERLQKKSQEK